MRKYLMGIFAVIVAVSLSAFTTPTAQSHPTTSWFKFVGSDNTDPLDYDLNTTETPCSDVSGSRCGVYSTEDPNHTGHPVFNGSQIFTLKQ